MRTARVEESKVAVDSNQKSTVQRTTSDTTTDYSQIPLWAQSSGLQMKSLTIGQPNDVYEQEADQVANRVMRMPKPTIQRRCACGGIAGPDGECAACKAKRLGLQRQISRRKTGILQTKRSSNKTSSREAPASVHETLRSSGQPLSASTRSFMEPRFGHDFSNVRVHTDSQAAQSADDVNARAYTVGNDVVFGAGQYLPGTSDGDSLLAHELVHTIQQQDHEPGLSPSAQQVQRGILDDLADLGDDIVEGAESVGGSIVEGAEYVGDRIAEGAEYVGDAVAEGAEYVGDQIAEGAEYVSEVASEAVDWLATEAGQLARRIADAFGVSVEITSEGLIINIGENCPIDTLLYSFEFPSLSKKFMVPIFAIPLGPGISATGEIGIAASLDSGMTAQLGPVCLNGARIVINPLTGNYSITGSVSATTGLGLQGEGRLGLRGELNLDAIIPIGGVPVPVSVPLIGLEGGGAILLRGLGGATLTIGGSLSIGGGAISLGSATRLDVGVGADLFLGAYAQLDIDDETVCRIYWQPYEWHKDIATSIGVSGNLTTIMGNPMRMALTINPTTIDQIPFDQIPLGIERSGFEDDCPFIDRLCDLLEALNYLPSQHGGVWDWSGPYGPGNRLTGPLRVYERDPGRASSATCRGACGPDCDTCEHIAVEHFTDPDTGEVWEYINFEICNTHDGCRQHDAGFDWAADVHGETGRWAIIMPWHMAANIECACNNLAGNCVAWIGGLPPYDDSAMFFADSVTKIGGATTPGASGLPSIPPDEARRIVQESSARIADLIQRRPNADVDREGAAEIDRQIDEINQQRQAALIQVVMEENPNVEVVDLSRGIFRVPVVDASGNTTYIYGSILVMWHMREVSPDVFRLSTQIGSVGHEPGVTTRLSASGTGVQGRVQPYPGDVDFVEEIDIEANSALEAGHALANTIIGFVQRNNNNPDLEFRYMIIMYSRGSGRWTAADIAAAARRGQAYERLSQQLTRASRNINTFWRARMDGRFIDITKVLSVRAMSSSGTVFFSTPRLGQTNAGYFDDPTNLPPNSVGEFGSAMRSTAISLRNERKYLKAAKRAYNYFTVIGNLEAMQAIEPAFRTDQARVNQQASVVEAIVRALGEDQPPSTILSRDEARDQLRNAANIIAGLPPASSVTPAPNAIASTIENISNQLQATSTGHLQPNDRQQDQLNKQFKHLKRHIDMGLEAFVKPILDRYLR